MVDVSVPQFQENFVEVVQHIPEERVRNASSICRVAVPEEPGTYCGHLEDHATSRGHQRTMKQNPCRTSSSYRGLNRRVRADGESFLGEHGSTACFSATASIVVESSRQRRSVQEEFLFGVDGPNSSCCPSASIFNVTVEEVRQFAAECLDVSQENSRIVSRCVSGSSSRGRAGTR